MRDTRAPRRVVLYARVSLDRGDTKSVDDQLAELRRWAEHEGWTIVAEHRDDGISASRFAGGRARPGWQSVMDTLAARQVDALLVWEISRASRDRPVFAALFAACADAGVLIGSDRRLHDPNDPEDAFFLDMGASRAVYESAKLSQRVRRAVESRAAAGRPAGSVPYGYRRVIDSTTGRTIGRDLHPGQAPIVAEIVERLLAREPADRIATDLNGRGIPTATGKAWRGGNLTKLALRPTYAGLRVHRGEVLEGVTATWPAIITEADHYNLLALFGSPERDKFRNPTHVKHLGAGLFRCGRDCDGRMRVAVQVNKPNRYDCRTCHRISRLQEPVDKYVQRVIVARLQRPDALEVLAGGDGDRRAAATEVARLRAEMADMQTLLREGRVKPLDFATFREGWEPRMAAAEVAARPAGLPSGVIELAGPDAAARWAGAPIETKRTVLDALVVVTLVPVPRQERNAGPAGVPPGVVITWR